MWSAGILTTLVPMMTSYWALATYCGSFGFLISANYALTTIILVDLLGMSKLTNAYGVVMFSEGVGNLLGPPIAGEKYITILCMVLCMHFTNRPCIRAIQKLFLNSSSWG